MTLIFQRLCDRPTLLHDHLEVWIRPTRTNPSVGSGPEPTLPCSLISLPHSGGLAGRTANPREVISSWSPLPQPLSRAPSYCESLHCLDSPLTSPSHAQARSQPSPLIPWPRRSPPWLQPPSLWDGNSCPLLPPPRFQLAGGHLPPDALRQLQPHTPTSKLQRIFLPPNPPPPLPTASLALQALGLHCQQLCLSLPRVPPHLLLPMSQPRPFFPKC